MSLQGYALDASALLASIQEEPGAEVVDARLPSAMISAVNLSEIAAKLLEKGVPMEEVRTILNGLSLQVIDFGADDALDTAALRVPTMEAGLSLGDRACLALARHEGLIALTADRMWAGISGLGIQVDLIR